MRILLIGATSYVASHFAEECLRRGWTMFALARDRVSQTILGLSDSGTVTVVPPDRVRTLGSVDAIVNFAYPKGLGAMRLHRATLRLMGGIAQSARYLSPRTVVHVSTQSVFGYVFAHDPRPVPVRWAAGDSYIESKALSEWLYMLNARRAPYAKVVLRLGNVIGPGAYWVSELARRILLGEPLGRGASNATYVGNVADYVCHLLAAEAGALQVFGPFHHLAEFSSYTWDRIAGRIAEVIGVQPMYSDSPIYPTRASFGNLVKAGIRYSALACPEILLAPIERLQQRRRARTFRPDEAKRGETAEHPTLHQPTVFRSHTLPGWGPKFGFETVVREMNAWVRGAGYVPSRWTV